MKQLDHQTGASLAIPLGPPASQVAIKQLGTNCCGFFGVNACRRDIWCFPMFRCFSLENKRLSDFILKHADKSCDICQKAVALKDKYRLCGQTVLNGFPDYDPTSFDTASFNPATWALWQPLPVHFVGSLKSEHYPSLKKELKSHHPREFKSPDCRHLNHLSACFPIQRTYEHERASL